MERLDTVTQIETPESVLLAFRLAGPGTRCYAYLIDVLLRLAFIVVIAIIAGILGIVETVGGLSEGFLLLSFFFIEWGYTTLFEAFWNGRTPGKRMLGLRVVKEGGYSISFYDSLLRNLLRAADVLPVFYGVGFVAMFTNGKLQRLGDVVAGTVVVFERSGRLQGDLDFVRRCEPFAAGDLSRGYVPRESTLTVLERYFRRWKLRRSARSREIAAILARPLADKLGYQGEDRLPRKDPVLFLLRVLRTFGYLERGDQGAESSSQPTAPRRRVVSISSIGEEAS